MTAALAPINYLLIHRRVHSLLQGWQTASSTTVIKASFGLRADLSR